MRTKFMKTSWTTMHAVQQLTFNTCFADVTDTSTISGNWLAPRELPMPI
jgi:hypothetical protein